MGRRRAKLTEQQLQELRSFKKNKDCSASELRRSQAIILWSNSYNVDLIEELTDFKKNYVFKLLKKYQVKGIIGLHDRPRAKPRALLTRGRREHIISVLHTSTPRQFGFASDIWTTGILGYLIKEQYNVHYKSKTSVYLLFKEAKFSYHKPDQQYKNRDQDKIDAWIKNERAQIKEAMEDDNTVVVVEDEMMLSTQTTTQKIWLPQGQFPKIDVSSKRAIRCIYGFLNVKTGQEHAFKTLRANSEETIKCLDRIGKQYKNKKIVIVWDNASWHKSAAIRAYLEKTKYNFHLIAFPPYAPDLNPQEHVWKAGRSHVTHNEFIADIDKAANQFINFLNNSRFNYRFL